MLNLDCPYIFNASRLWIAPSIGTNTLKNATACLRDFLLLLFSYAAIRFAIHERRFVWIWMMNWLGKRRRIDS